MRTYRQLTPGERYALSALRKQGFSQAHIARALRRHPSTISREVRRNSRDGTGRVYRPGIADEYACWRRSRSRRNQRFGAEDWALVLTRLKQQWSPEQISGRLKRDGRLRISHETIYRHIWRDKRRGGSRYKLLRQAGKKRRKRYGACDSRGRLAGKRHISERPAAAQDRTLVGHWEIDTVVGPGRPCIVTLVERGTGYVMIGKLRAHTVAALNRGALRLIDLAPMPVLTVTADNVPNAESRPVRGKKGPGGVGKGPRRGDQRYSSARASGWRRSSTRREILLSIMNTGSAWTALTVPKTA